MAKKKYRLDWVFANAQEALTIRAIQTSDGGLPIIYSQLIFACVSFSFQISGWLKALYEVKGIQPGAPQGPAAQGPPMPQGPAMPQGPPPPGFNPNVTGEYIIQLSY